MSRESNYYMENSKKGEKLKPFSVINASYHCDRKRVTCQHA
jgi:hypothetical protein